MAACVATTAARQTASEKGLGVPCLRTCEEERPSTSDPTGRPWPSVEPHAPPRLTGFAASDRTPCRTLITGQDSPASLDHLTVIHAVITAAMGTGAADAAEGAVMRAELQRARTAALISMANYDTYGKKGHGCGGGGCVGVGLRAPPGCSGETAAGVNAGSGAWSRW